MADDTLGKLTEIINDVTGIDPARVESAKSLRQDLAIDSLSMVEIIYAVEDTFGIEIPDADAKALNTVGDAVAYIERAKS